MLEKDQAICLRAVDYSDTSQIVTLFGKNSGKISAIAKGSKRAKSSFEGPIEVFSYGEIVFSIPASGKLATLTEFGQRPIFRQLRSRLFTLNCGLFAVELVDNLTHEHDRHPALFDAMIQGDHMKQVQHLSLVFVNPLDMDIKKRRWIDLNARFAKDVVGKALLVFIFYLPPAHPESGIVGIRDELRKAGHIATEARRVIVVDADALRTVAGV